MNKIRFYVVSFFKDEKKVGLIEMVLFVSSIITGILWWKDNNQLLEPITIILASTGGILDVIKRIIKAPRLPKITFTELSASSSRESSFFFGATLTNLSDAFKASKETNKGIFLVIYDLEHSTNSNLNYSLGAFTRYEQTKRLINEYFIQAVIPSNTVEAQPYIPINYHLENCLLVVLDSKREIIRQEGVYANADEGLKRVSEDIQKINFR